MKKTCTILALALTVCCSLLTNSGIAQIINTVAGNGMQGFSGDHGQATAAELDAPNGITLDNAGNLYIADNSSHCIRKVTTSGIITTVAGNGVGFSGDGGQATDAQLSNPSGIFVDTIGNLYIADSQNYRVRKVNTLGTITTIAGNGTSAFSGDGGQATDAGLTYPSDLVLDAAGNLYITDMGNNHIRKINTSGIITTVAGNGTEGYSGDGGQATAAELSAPEALAFDAVGNLYVADYGSGRIRKINSFGIISTIVGTVIGFSGDGGQATDAQLNAPIAGITFDAMGNLYISDQANDRIRKVNTLGIINTVAGNGTLAFGGDGGQAINAELFGPGGIAIDANGNLYIADTENDRIRMVTNLTTAGIEQLKENNNRIYTYPNPSTGNINITSTYTIDELKVTDILGQLVYEAKPRIEKTTLQLDNAGVYFITITSGTEISTKKVIVNK